MLQGPKTVLDPTATLPRPDEPWPTDGGFKTYHIELLLPGFTDHDDRHRTIRRTRCLQPCIAHPGELRAVTPGPLALLQVVTLDLPPIRQFEAIGTLPFHEERALVGSSHMAHK